MPKSWYDRNVNKITDDLNEDEIAQRKFNLSILADKKPYFMRYIYPNLMKQYNTYIKNTGKRCIREFRITIDELLEKESTELNEREIEFLKHYYIYMPVGKNPCVLNKICMKFEEKFDEYFSKNTYGKEFDYSIMKSGQKYTNSQYNNILKLYKEYIQRLQEFIQSTGHRRHKKGNTQHGRINMMHGFKVACNQVCSNATQLCDIILDVCYSRNNSKQFCWDICSDEIIANLLKNNNNIINFPSQDDDGDIEFCGKRFSLKSKEVNSDQYNIK